MMSPMAKPLSEEKPKPDAGATRVAEAMSAHPPPDKAPPPACTSDAMLREL
ncbi:hypothetical protein GALL_541400 [mine drainage metagenome]|uniref:Uncharacterized protein n=1 Tax=mine drainage metagenome TaxID=410659 RepID=A0A1J5PL97_9ZZZZ